jgi:phosphoribosylformylglycinamidine synthase
MARVGFAPRAGDPAGRQSIYLRDMLRPRRRPLPGHRPPPVDLSDGGLGIALAEMAMASGIGAQIPWVLDADPLKVWFGEDQGRYILTLNIDPQGEQMDPIWQEAMDANVGLVWIGETGGASLKLGRARAIPVGELKAAHESWFPAFMAA